MSVGGSFNALSAMYVLERMLLLPTTRWQFLTAKHRCFHPGIVHGLVIAWYKFVRYSFAQLNEKRKLRQTSAFWTCQNRNVIMKQVVLSIKILLIRLTFQNLIKLHKILRANNAKSSFSLIAADKSIFWEHIQLISFFWEHKQIFSGSLSWII